MISHELHNLVSDSLEEEYNITFALIKLRVDSCSLKL